jgi:hypothetical protein
MTKRQEALEAMAQILQGNPELWKVAGDLFVKNMDWPGAQEMAKRLAKTIDPKLTADTDEDPALQAAQQQIQAMGQEMESMYSMLQNVQKSMEAQDMERKDFEAQIKMYDAETKRAVAMSAAMTPDQVQDIVMGTLHGMMSTNELVNEMQRDEGMQMQEQLEMPMQSAPPEQMMPEQMPPEGLPQ